METTTLRVRASTRDRLVAIGRRRGLSMPDLLDDLADRAEGDALLEAANEHFAAEREHHRAHVEAWDATAGDALGAA
jgi:hypothetical protein